jgi:hypothetical protein
MKKLAIIFVLSLSSVIIFSSQVMADNALPAEWIAQFGTGSADYAVGMSVDASGLYVAGTTYGVFPGQTGAGSADTFVRRYDLDGSENWTCQLGTGSDDYAVGISVDTTGVYVAGTTYGVFPGQTGAGSTDVFVRKNNFDGTENWTRQFGTSNWDEAKGISADASGVYVVGTTYGTFPGQTNAGSADTFVRRYNLNGSENWTRQLGTSSADYAVGISVDETGVYVAGTTYGVFPGQTSAGSADTFVRKYNLDGSENWTHQLGTDSADYAAGISIDATGIYLAGYVFSTGSADIFVRRNNLDGTENWTRQFGTSYWDEAKGISVDASGVYVAGTTSGVFPGETGAGYIDVFVQKYNLNGIESWTRQFGTDLADCAAGISVDETGVYVAGYTDGALPGQTSEGDTDAFISKFSASKNEPPVADAGAPYNDINEGDNVTLDGSGSFDPDNDISLYEWDINNDGQYDAAGITTTVVFNDNGVYTISLKVTDSSGESDTDTATINVGNKPPEVWADSDQPVYVGEPLTVDVEFRDEGIFDTHTTSITWGDGNTDDLAMIETNAEGSFIGSHVYTWPDTYEVTVTVTDNDFGTGSCVLTVEILPTPEVMIEVLTDNLNGMDLPVSIAGSLDSSLDNVVKVLEDSNAQNDIAAINDLEAFINKVEAQRGKKISEEYADTLISNAQEIIAALSGG